MKMTWLWILSLCSALASCTSVEGLQNEKGRCFNDAFARECNARGRGEAADGVNDGQQQARYDRSNQYGPGYHGCMNGVPQSAAALSARTYAQERRQVAQGLTVTAFYCPTDGSVDCEQAACEEGDWEGSSAGYSQGGKMYDVGWNIGYCNPDASISALGREIDQQLAFICAPPPPLD